MAAFTRELTDEGFFVGKVTGWATFLRNIDEKTKKAVSASGGTWNPSTPLILTNAGLALACRADFSHASAVIFPAPGKSFIFGDDDYFKYATASPLVRQIDVSPFTGAAPRGWSNFTLFPIGGETELRAWRSGGRTRIEVRGYNGARISQVDCIYRVLSPHTAGGEGIPAELPKMRLIKVARDGTITPVGTASPTVAEPDGWVREDQPASAAAYYNLAAPKTVTMFIDTSHVMDTSQYSYFFEFVEEDGDGVSANGAGTRSHIRKIRLFMKIPDLRPQ